MEYKIYDLIPPARRYYPRPIELQCTQNSCTWRLPLPELVKTMYPPSKYTSNRTSRLYEEARVAPFTRLSGGEGGGCRRLREERSFSLYRRRYLYGLTRRLGEHAERADLERGLISYRRA